MRSAILELVVFCFFLTKYGGREEELWARFNSSFNYFLSNCIVYGNASEKEYCLLYDIGVKKYVVGKFDVLT